VGKGKENEAFDEKGGEARCDKRAAGGGEAKMPL